ncbi:hypothetical protein ACI49Z_003613 [Cronobacter turicensis]
MLLEYIKYIMLAAYSLAMFFYIRHLTKIKAIEMNAEALTKQPLFLAALTIPFLSFITFGLVAWLGHNFQLDGEGLNNFLNISKLPLGLLSLSVPLGVIVSNIHRTIQTDKQIKEAQKKNKIDAFYAHRKNTIELLDNLNLQTLTIVGEDIKLKFENNYSIYKRVYPEASITNDNYAPSYNILHETQYEWIKIANILKCKDKLSIEMQTEKYHEIERCLEALHYLLEFESHKNIQLYFAIFSAKDKKRNELTSRYSGERDLKDAIICYWNSYSILMASVDIKFNISFSGSTMPILDYLSDASGLFEDIELHALVDGVSPSLKIANLLKVH